MNSEDVKYLYNEDYFLKSVDGFREFELFDGTIKSLFPRFKRNIELLELSPEHIFLEIGCGRGEVCIYHALSGGSAKGIDFSVEAIDLAKKKNRELKSGAKFEVCSFLELIEDNDSYDRILASEFIEHISEEEGYLFFKKAFDLLKPGGKMLVFTMPNTLQRKYGYPLQRLILALIGKKIPKIQEDTLSDHYKYYHLNEQNFFSIKKFVKTLPFVRIQVGYDIDLNNKKSTINRIIKKLVLLTPLRHLLCNNIYLLAEK